MADARAKEQILTDQDSGYVLERVLSNGKNLFLIDNIVSHVRYAPKYCSAMSVQDRNAIRM
jgi:hypothetical protein